MDKNAQYNTTYEIPTVQRIYMINGKVFLGGTPERLGCVYIRLCSLDDEMIFGKKKKFVYLNANESC